MKRLNLLDTLELELTMAKVLIDLGSVPPLVSRQDAIEMIGRNSLDALVKDGFLKPIKKSPAKNGKVYFRRIEIYKYKQILK